MKSVIAKGAIISYIAIFLNLAITFFYTPWMIRQIGVSDYGLYSLVGTFIAYFIIDFGLSGAITRFIAKYRAEGNQTKVENMLGLTTKVYLCIDAVIFLVLFVCFFFLKESEPTGGALFRNVRSFTGEGSAEDEGHFGGIDLQIFLLHDLTLDQLQEFSLDRSRYIFTSAVGAGRDQLIKFIENDDAVGVLGVHLLKEIQHFVIPLPSFGGNVGGINDNDVRVDILQALPDKCLPGTRWPACEVLVRDTPLVVIQDHRRLPAVVVLVVNLFQKILVDLCGIRERFRRGRLTVGHVVVIVEIGFFHRVFSFL